MQHVVYGPVIGYTTDLVSSSNVITKKYPVVPIERSVSGSYWCTRYTDGWMEQGGYVPLTSTSGYSSMTIPFGWSFSGNPVFIECQPVSSNAAAGGSDGGCYGIHTITSSDFSYNRGGGANYRIGIMWIAKGLDPNWSTPEPDPSGSAYVSGDTLYSAASSVTNNTLNVIGGSVGNNTLNL